MKEINKHCYSEVYFSPHVADFFRGILITSHFSLSERMTRAKKLTSKINKILETIPNYPLSNKTNFNELNPGFIPSLIGSYPLNIFHQVLL